MLLCYFWSRNTHIPFSSVPTLHFPPPLPDGCPIRSTSRPVLANHTTSKPGGGVKKVTGVGGTTYEISVWVTDNLHDLLQRGKRSHRTYFHIPELDIIQVRRLLKNDDWLKEQALLVLTLLSVLCHWSFFSASLSDLTKLGTLVHSVAGWVCLHLATIWAIDWCDCIITAGYRYVYRTRRAIQWFAVLHWYISTAQYRVLTTVSDTRKRRLYLLCVKFKRDCWPIVSFLLSEWTTPRLLQSHGEKRESNL